MQCSAVTMWWISLKYSQQALHRFVVSFMSTNSIYVLPQFLLCCMQCNGSFLFDWTWSNTIIFPGIKTLPWDHSPLTKQRNIGLGCSLQWRHNGHGGVSNHQPPDCSLSHLFRRRSKKTSKLRVTGLSAGNSPLTGEFPAQMASNTENVSVSWRHHDLRKWTLGRMSEIPFDACVML